MIDPIGRGRGGGQGGGDDGRHGGGPPGPDERPARPAKPRPERLDERVVREGLAATRSAAQALILSGRVLVDDVPSDKPGTRIAAEKSVRLKGGPRPFVSRGGEKLAAALDELGLDARGRICLDVGASTGGFTDCLLQRGAERVVAVDVGHGQIHSRLVLDPRVEVREGVNARHLAPADFADRFDLVVADVSFISLELVLPAIDACAPAAELLLLVKPQFEVGREQVGKGGVVRDDALRIAAADRIARAGRRLGRAERGRVDSRVPGPKGNREIFLLLTSRRAPSEEASQAEATPHPGASREEAGPSC
ncbi:MAG: TlyA family RNA methyltransferase [Myxococcota bacterium]